MLHIFILVINIRFFSRYLSIVDCNGTLLLVSIAAIPFSFFCFHFYDSKIELYFFRFLLLSVPNIFSSILSLLKLFADWQRWTAVFVVLLLGYISFSFRPYKISLWSWSQIKSRGPFELDPIQMYFYLICR